MKKSKGFLIAMTDKSWQLFIDVVCVKFYRFYAPELPDGVSKKRRAEIKQWSCDEAENQDAIKWL